MESVVGDYLDEDSLTWQFKKEVPEKSIIPRKKQHNYYKVNFPNEDGKISYFDVTLFTVNGNTYLDFFPDFETLAELDLFAMHTLPVHSLAKVIINKPDALEIMWFREDWLNELYEDKKIDLEHQKLYTDGDGDGTITLTASSEALHEFIVKFGNDPEAFDCGDDSFGDGGMCLELKRI